MICSLKTMKMWGFKVLVIKTIKIKNDHNVNFLQAILKRITAKEPHYNHLQWVRMSITLFPS